MLKINIGCYGIAQPFKCHRHANDFDKSRKKYTNWQSLVGGVEPSNTSFIATSATAEILQTKIIYM